MCPSQVDFLFFFFFNCVFFGWEVFGFYTPLESEMQNKDLTVGPVWDLKCFTHLKIQHTTLNFGNRLRLCDCEFNSSPDTFCRWQGEALRQILVNRYYGNVKAGPRRDSLTTFSNGPLAPGGPGKSPTGV